jgi:hypothetical protein
VELTPAVTIPAKTTANPTTIDKKPAQKMACPWLMLGKRGLRAVWRTRFGFTMMEETRFPS